jgi:acetyl esterase
MDLPGDPASRYYLLCTRFAAPPPPSIPVHDAPPLRWYEPPAASAAILWLHGGRFISGGLDTHDSLCRLLAHASGRTVVALEYRLAPAHPVPAALDDISAALPVIASRYPRLAIGGDSAGGCLALTAALQSQHPLDALVLVYPMLDATCHLPSHAIFESGPGPSSLDMRAGWDLWLPPDTDRRHPDISPLFAPKLSRLPRTFLVTAGFDSLRDEGLHLASRLLAAAIPLTHTHLNGHIHGFLTYPAAFTAALNTIRSIASLLAAG